MGQSLRSATSDVFSRRLTPGPQFGKFRSLRSGAWTKILPGTSSSQKERRQDRIQLLRSQVQPLGKPQRSGMWLWCQHGKRQDHEDSTESKSGTPSGLLHVLAALRKCHLGIKSTGSHFGQPQQDSVQEGRGKDSGSSEIPTMKPTGE